LTPISFHSPYQRLYIIKTRIFAFGASFSHREAKKKKHDQNKTINYSNSSILDVILLILYNKLKLNVFDLCFHTFKMNSRYYLRLDYEGREQETERAGERESYGSQYQNQKIDLQPAHSTSSSSLFAPFYASATAAYAHCIRVDPVHLREKLHIYFQNIIKAILK